MVAGRNASPLGSDASFAIDEDTGAQEYTFADRVKERIEDLVGPAPEKPIISPEHKGLFPHLQVGAYFDGRLPTIIRTMSFDNISDLQVLMGAWYSYLAYQTRFIATEKSEAKAQRDFILTHLKTKWKREKRGSDEAIKHMVMDDYRYVKWDAKYEELHAAHTFMDAALDNAKRALGLVSREVSIKQAKLESAPGSGRRLPQGVTSNAFSHGQDNQGPPKRPKKSLRLSGRKNH